MKNKGFGHLKTRLFTIKTSKNVGLGGPLNFFLLAETRHNFPNSPQSLPPNDHLMVIGRPKKS